MKPNRCFFVLFIAVVLSITILVSCQKTDETQPSAEATLRIIGEDYSPMQGLEKIKDKFTEETGIKVEISRFDGETLRKKYLGEFQARGSNYDVIMGQAFDVGLLASNGWVLNLDKALSKPGWKDPNVDLSNFSEQILDLSCRFDDTLYGLPCSAQCMYLWYRKDLFENKFEQKSFLEKYGYELPSPRPEKSMTWNQYRDVAEFFTRTKGAIACGVELENNLFGTILQGKNHIALWFEFQNFLKSFGASFVSVDGKTVTADQPAAIEALKFYLSLRKFAPPGSANYTWDEALSAFQNGQAVMGLMWSDSISAVEDSSSSQVSGKIGYAATPYLETASQSASVFGGWGFFVNVKSKFPREAVLFIQWANRPDVQLLWAKNGGIPATLSTYSSPEYASLPGAKAHLSALHHLVGWSTEPYSGRMIEIGQNALAKAFADEISPTQALTEISEYYRKLIIHP